MKSITTLFMGEEGLPDMNLATIIVLGALIIFVGIAIIRILLLIRKDLKSRNDFWVLEQSPTQAKIEQTQMIGDGLKELVEHMREKDRAERDAELAAYAEAKRKQPPILTPIATHQTEERIHQTNPKAEKILIPEGLTEEQRAVLKDFFEL